MSVSLAFAVPPRDAPGWKTPMFEQYWKIKEGAPGALLFYRMGDFYELFGEDAIIAAPLLEIQLTARDKEAAAPIPMCGVPVHAWESYAEKIIGAGRKVALCEQLSDPAAGKTKLVERGIVRILTPGLPVHFNKISGKSAHWFFSLHLQEGGKTKADLAKRKFTLLVYDFLAAELFKGQLEGEEALNDIFKRLDPKEILIPASQLKYFPENFHWAARMTPWAGEEAEQNLKEYLLFTQRCSRENLATLLPEAKDIAQVSGAQLSTHARLPASVLEQWAIFPELFEIFDRCGSAVGSRRLRSILANPLRDVTWIQLRQKLLAGLTNAADIFAQASEVYDFERILGRFRVGAAAPKELVRFVLSLEAVEKTLSLVNLNSGLWKDHLAREGLVEFSTLSSQVQTLRQKLQRALNTGVDAGRVSKLSELIQPGFDATFDDLKFLNDHAEEWLVQFEEKLKAESQISTLKLRYNKIFGFYIEITKANLAKVPSYFERKQTTVNGERFTCAELRNKESEILSASFKAETRAREILEELQREVLGQDAAFKAYIGYFSWVDALAAICLAVQKQSRFGTWTYPEVKPGRFYFEIKDARHPVIESLMGSFVANSICLDGAQKKILLLTGPNMAGKSTLMRQTGLCLLLGQCGLPVPAEAMNFSPCSGFYSRMGASDKILQGESTFMVEMKESAQILREADANSFILIDEIGRGTSTQDGLAIARAVLEYLHNQTEAIVIFATHYHELSEDVQLPHVQNGSMEIKEWKGELVFLRNLKLSPAESSYGIYVAKMAGLPKSVVSRAEKLFLESGHEDLSQLNLFASVRQLAPESVSADAGETADTHGSHVGEPWLMPLIDQISSADLNELSPRQAWDLLATLQKQIALSPQKQIALSSRKQITQSASRGG